MSCPDASVVQGFVEGSLADRDRTDVEAHVDGCASCRRLIAALAMTRPPTTSVTLPESPPPRPRARLGAGELVGRYRVTGYLGRGGMGIVYAAHDPELRRDLAVKLLRGEHSGEESRARLVREAQAMAQIAHPNVIGVYDVGTWNDQVFVVMELATGGTLRAWCQRPRTQRQILDAFISAGRGLAAAHAVGLVHRDFKPDNVLVGGDGRMRVTDFGLARTHDALPESLPPVQPSGVALVELTATGAVMGTPGYMAPELYRGEPSDARTDQFAFCVALWEALHGQRPFAGSTETELVHAIETGALVAPKRRVPVAIRRALEHGLAAAADARWPSMDDLLAALMPRPRRWRYAAASLALATAAILVAIAAWPSPTAVATTVGVDALDVKTGSAYLQTVPSVGRALGAWMAGDHALAKRESADAVAKARAAGAPRVLAETLTSQGYLMSLEGDLAGAEASLTEAMDLAEKHGYDEVKTNAIVQLVGVLDAAGKPDERLRALAQATTARTSANDRIRAQALEAEAARTQDTEAAIRKWNEALGLRDKLGGLGERANNRNGLGLTLYQAGRYDDARTVIKQSLADLETRPGDVTGKAFATAANLAFLANIELERKAWPAAEAASRRALAIWTTLLGANSPLLMSAHESFSAALLAQGKRDEADAAFRRALELANHDATKEASAHAYMARFYRQHDRVHDAVTEAERAVDLITGAFGANHPDLVQYQLVLAKVLYADGQIGRARPIAEGALVKLDAPNGDALLAADARFVIARCLPKEERVRARELAAQAREVVRAAGPKAAERLAQIDAWLADPDAKPMGSH
jgi:tetratricopeptide (TPR) repeat protein